MSEWSDFKPSLGLNRSGLACWFSIMALIRDHSPCYLWTVTSPEVMPDTWFSRAHSQFLTNVKDYSRQHKFPSTWGGVRVFEPHPAGHGLHSHLVLRGYMQWHFMAECCRKAGLGRISVHPEAVTPRVAGYLANYLNKDKGRLVGCRKWACVGSYSGELCRDIQFESYRISEIKAVAAKYRAQGWKNYPAYLMAVREVSNPKNPRAEDDPY